MAAYIFLKLREENGPVTVAISSAILFIFCLMQWAINKLVKHRATELIPPPSKLLPAKRSGPDLIPLRPWVVDNAEEDEKLVKLQAEERLKMEDEKLAAELQEEEMRLADEKERMLSTNDGCAFLFVQSVLKVCKGLSDVLGDKDILPVSEDDMVYMTNRMLELRDTFQAKGKDVSVDIGYHYTSSSALKHIQQDGLMTHCDRLSNKKLNQQEVEPKHALLFGDGVYTGNFPAEFIKYGEIGILVARLQGQKFRVQPDDVNIGGTLKNYSMKPLNKADTLGQAAVDAGFDTIIGNKSIGRQPYYRLDEVVLLRSSQCIPLVYFPSSLIKYYHTEVPEPIKHYLDAMEKATNTYLNQPHLQQKTLPSHSSTTTKPFQVGVVPSPTKKRPKQRPKKAPPSSGIGPVTQLAVGTQPFAFGTQRPIVTGPLLPLVSSTSGFGTNPTFGWYPNTSSAVKEELITYTAPNHLPLPDLSKLVPPKVWNALDLCSICHDTLGNDTSLLLQTKCNHIYHKECLQTALQHSHKCPSCQIGIVGVKLTGKSPSGTMKVSVKQDISCQGYDTVGCIEIKYDIFEGVQKSYHEKEGESFDATTRYAYLPNTRDGYYLVKRLKFAFRRGMTFQIGTSLTTNKEGVVTWASIHHKTSRTQGTYGWPDQTYFVRVNSELDNKCVPRASDLCL